jgi:methyl-accepting chemotaxis protein
MINPTTSTRTNGLTNNGQPAKSKRPLATKSNPSNDELQSLRAKVEAIEKSQAVIEFALDGTILTASEKFLQIFGYRLSDIQEKPHSIFVEAATASGADYKAFLHDLAEGNVAAGKFKRLAKGGKEVWIQASYSPVLGAEGLPVKIVKLATDCTEHNGVQNSPYKTAYNWRRAAMAGSS